MENKISVTFANEGSYRSKWQQRDPNMRLKMLELDRVRFLTATGLT